MSLMITLSRNLAEKFHAGQKYGEHDYMYHIDEVREMLIKNHGTVDDRLLIIANLHDSLEDTEITVELLSAIFDKDVVDAIIAITHNKGESRTDYLNRVKSNALARKVKMQDSFVNLSNSMQRKDMKRIRKYGEYLQILATD